MYISFSTLLPVGLYLPCCNVFFRSFENTVRSMMVQDWTFVNFYCDQLSVQIVPNDTLMDTSRKRKWCFYYIPFHCKYHGVVQYCICYKANKVYLLCFIIISHTKSLLFLSVCSSIHVSVYCPLDCISIFMDFPPILVYG